MTLPGLYVITFSLPEEVMSGPAARKSSRLSGSNRVLRTRDVTGLSRSMTASEVERRNQKRAQSPVGCAYFGQMPLGRYDMRASSGGQTGSCYGRWGRRTRREVREDSAEHRSGTAGVIA